MGSLKPVSATLIKINFVSISFGNSEELSHSDTLYQRSNQKRRDGPVTVENAMHVKHVTSSVTFSAVIFKLKKWKKKEKKILGVISTFK